MYRKYLTILLPLYLFLDWFKSNKSIIINSNFHISESLILNKNDEKLIVFLQCLNSKKLYFKKKSRIIVIHDDLKKRIYKYSSKESSREIKNNYLLLDSENSLSTPKNISIIESKYSIFTEEEFIDLMPLTIKSFNTDIYNDLLFKNICDNLNNYHIKNLKKVKVSFNNDLNQYDFLISKNDFNKFEEIKHKFLSSLSLTNNCYFFKSCIHGDATYRNILSSNGELSFIDFERAAFDFPEIDYLNFILDLNFHKTKHTSYKNYIDYLYTIYSNEEYLAIFKSLEMNNHFKLINFSNIRYIYLKYLIRQLAIVTNVSYYHRGVYIKSIYKSLNKKLNNVKHISRKAI